MMTARITYAKVLLVPAFLGLAAVAVFARPGGGNVSYPIKFALPSTPIVIDMGPGAGLPKGPAQLALPQSAATEIQEGLQPDTAILSGIRPVRSLQGTSATMRPLGVELAVDYDMGAAAAGRGAVAVQPAKALAGTIDVRKPIRIGGGAPGKIDVKIGSGANIYLNGGQLASLYAAQGRAIKPPAGIDGDGFVSLSELRGAGLKIRYDATGDALVIDGDG